MRSQKRSGLENVLRFLLVSLTETWIWFAAGWLLGTVCMCGCSEALTYLRQHGY